MTTSAPGRAVRAAWLLALLVWAGAAAAQVAIPPLTGPVVDTTHTLSPAELRSLDATLRDFAARKGSQVVILLVPTTRPEEIEQFSIRVAEAWKIGRKGTDDGVILVVAKDDRELRIEVGYGLEGAIPDIIARRIIEDYIVPRFRAGDFHGGLAAGAGAIMKLIEGEKLPERRNEWRPGAFEGNTLVWLFFLAVVLGGVLRRIFGRLAGASLVGGGIGVVGGVLAGSLLVGVIAALFAFLVALAGGGPGYYGRGGRGHWGGGGSGGSSGGWGGGGFGGGGGGFGGGGASGRW